MEHEPTIADLVASMRSQRPHTWKMLGIISILAAFVFWSHFLMMERTNTLSNVAVQTRELINQCRDSLWGFAGWVKDHDEGVDFQVVPTIPDVKPIGVRSL